jgi:dipeptidyl aminopeptidase/acylaminoacyl peptidase
MKRFSHWPAVALTLLVTLATLSPAQAPPARKTPLRVEDLYLFDAPKSPVLFPNGKQPAYIRSWIDTKTKQERNSLWIVAGGKVKTRPMEDGEPDARAPVVSPDGKWIAFLSTRPRPDGWKQIAPAPAASDPATDIWLISADGGPAMPLGGPDKLYGRVFNDGFYGRVAFSPDGKKLVFIGDDGADPRTAKETANGVTILRPDQGEGYTGYGAAQIWVAELSERVGPPLTPDPSPQGGEGRKAFAARKIERLTNDDVWYGDPQWSPDGKTIAVHANKTNDRESVRYSINRNFDIWAIDVATKKQTQLTTGPGPEVSPRWSPDGKRIACLSIPRKGSHRDVFRLATIRFKDSESSVTVLPEYDHVSFPLPEQCWEDDEHVSFNCECGIYSAVGRRNAICGAIGPPPFSPSDTGLRALLPSGNQFLRDRLEAQVMVVKWKNDGLKLEGILTMPPQSVAQPPYKLIVHPHGGPHSRSTLGFDFTVQVLAAHGYAVFQPNFRGSSGYGQWFIDADRGDFGGGDMRDILTGIDCLVQRGLVDPKRQFVYGTSYGGFMTTWLVGHTKQFRAAVAQNAVTDLNMMWSLSDLQSWVEWEFGSPWEVPDKLRKHSPLTYADQIETPTLILHSRDDRRCPLPMGKAFHQALLAHGVPTQMVIYPDEGHAIRQPRHREDVLRRVLAWFAKYDEGN